MPELTHFSLCTGIGGIDIAAEWAGFKTIAQCEIDNYASKVLAKNFKGVHNFGDIRTVTNESVRAAGIDPGDITVLSAGFPCQPYSLAGKGLGDGDSRDLWGEVARVIGELRPRWFVGENTPGLFARANQRYFARVVNDLSALGYSVSWGMWGACDVGAPHKRKRVFIVAYAVGFDSNARRPESKKLREAGTTNGGDDISDTYSRRHLYRQIEIEPAKTRIDAQHESLCLCNDVSDSDGTRKSQRQESSQFNGMCKDVPDTYNGHVVEKNKIQAGRDAFGACGAAISYPNIAGLEGYNDGSAFAAESVKSDVRSANRIRNSLSFAGRKWKAERRDRGLLTTIQYDEAGRNNSRGIPEYVGGKWWAPEPDVGRLAYGISDRVDKLRCYGNAVVPQQIYPIFQAIADYESQ